jgi:hypothetical protein
MTREPTIRSMSGQCVITVPRLARLHANAHTSHRTTHHVLAGARRVVHAGRTGLSHAVALPVVRAG